MRQWVGYRKCIKVCEHTYESEKHKAYVNGNLMKKGKINKLKNCKYNRYKHQANDLHGIYIVNKVPGNYLKNIKRYKQIAQSKKLMLMQPCKGQSEPPFWIIYFLFFFVFFNRLLRNDKLLISTKRKLRTLSTIYSMLDQ